MYFVEHYNFFPKFNHFISVYPDFMSLAIISESFVLKAWQGLGYNRRALYLKKAAQIIIERYKGILFLINLNPFD